MIEIIQKLFKREVVDNSNKPIPCIECGACCAYFRVEFDKNKNKQVPEQKIVFFRRKNYMQGTERFKGRCSSLNGEIGKECKCDIYQNRPDVCDLFPVWLEDGRQNPRCIKAREFHGLKGKID